MCSQVTCILACVLMGTLIRFCTRGCSEYKMMLKERASGMYRLSAFYFARTASDLPIELSAPSLLIILVYFMVRCRWSMALHASSCRIILAE